MSDTMSLSNSEWKEVKLENVVSKLGDGLHGTPKYDDNGEYYFVNGNNLGDGKITIKDSTKKTSIDEYKKYKKDLNDRTILVSINGTLGNIGIYNNEKCFLGKSACYFNVKENVEKLFIKYVVTNNHFQEHISVFANGTTIKNVSLKTMREYPFLLPPLPEQKAIAEALSSLDDKIDLLHRQNKTLEQMAETLFRQWFENFEFSNNCKQGGPFKNSELGLIPFNWRVGQIKDVVSILDSGSRPKGGVGQYSSGIPSIGAENVKGIGMYDYSKTKYIPKEYFKTMKNGILTNRDILVYKDGGTPGTFIPHFSLVGEGFPYETMTINEHVFRVITKESYQQNYLYLWLNTKLIISELGERGTGAAIPGINSTEFKETVLLIPETSVLKAFNEQVEPLIHKILKNACSIRTLGIMRDTLLPKLISGEVRIV